MRRKDREITGRENIEPILRACKTCRVAMIADGAPYVVPLNFGYTWDDDGLTLYFHSGLKGKKIDALRADPRVCFELDTEQGVTGEGDIACRYSFAFSSIVGYGSMEFAKTPDEKAKGHLTSSCSTRPAAATSPITMRRCPLPRCSMVRADSFEASRKALRPRKPE